MPTYLYCILNEPLDALGTVTGIDGAPVRSVGAAVLAAWVSDVSEASVTPTIDRLKAHDAVCATALAAGDTPLPVRFRQTFADDAAVIETLVARRQVLAHRLACVAGCVELRVVASRDPALDDAPPRAEPADERPRDRVEGSIGPGTAFLLERARRLRDERKRDHWCELVRQRVAATAGPLIVAYQPCEMRRGLAYLPLLVRRTEVDRCRARIKANLSLPGPLSLLGPFPPYSFASDG